MQRFFTNTMLTMLFICLLTAGLSTAQEEAPAARPDISREKATLKYGGAGVRDARRHSRLSTPDRIYKSQQTDKTMMLTGTRRQVPQDYATIQEAIDSSAHGDTVLVSDGVYYENIRFHGKAIIVASLYLINGDTSHIKQTVIDGSKPSNPDSGSVVYFTDGEDTTSVLCGFTIRGGTGTSYVSTTLKNYRAGGGIDCERVSGATIRNNRITANQVTGEKAFGAGVEFYADHGILILEGNRIFDNHLSAGKGYGYGGGVDVWGEGVFARLVDNTIEQNTNTAETYAVGGGMSMGADSILADGILRGNTFRGNMADAKVNNGVGGGLFFTNTAAMEITNNLFDGNLTKSRDAYAEGGGLLSEDKNKKGTSRKTIKNNRFINNKTSALSGARGTGGALELFNSRATVCGNYFAQNSVEGGDAGGGAIRVYKSAFLFENNIIVRNKASYGGAIYIYGQPQSGALDIINNTIVNNSAVYTGGAINVSGTEVSIMNTILWDNSAPYGSQISGTKNVRYSDVQGGMSGTGNMNSDPLFADTDNYYLSESSPCIDAGNPDSRYNDPEDPANSGFALWPALGTVRCDIGAHGGDPNRVTGLGTDDHTGTQRPVRFMLAQNYPNPFNPGTTIPFQISSPRFVTLKIYNLLGQEVATLVSARLKAGKYKYVWDASALASGVYFYELKTENGFSQTKKLMLMK